MSEIEAEIEAVVIESKKTFDMRERVKNRKLREGAITVYLDEDAGDLYGGAYEPKGHEANVLRSMGIPVERERWGILGEIDEILSADPEADVSELRERAVEAGIELQKSGLTYYFRAIPELIVKDARRKSKDEYKDANGKIPEDKDADYKSRLTARLLAATIQKVVDADGAVDDTKLSLEAAAELEDFLPRSEYAKLDAKLNEVQFKQAISDAVTADADF